MTQPFCFYSNKVENLYLHLRDRLFQTGTTPFTDRIVIVPSQAMKRWLMLQLAEDSQVGVCAGIRFPFLNAGLMQLTEALYHVNTKNILSSNDLIFFLEAQVRHWLAHSSDLSSEEKNVLEPLFHYLQPPSSSPKLIDKRISGLCTQLGPLFSKYGQFCSQLIKTWDSNVKPTTWQGLLWRSLYRNGHWSHEQKLIEEVTQKTAQPTDLQVHLFCLSFVADWQVEILMHIAKTIPVHFHLLSPCQGFWTDIQSEHESLKLLKYWKKKGVTLEEREKLEDYLRDTNPLLANFGKVGREFTAILEEKELTSLEDYETCESKTFSLLDHIQNDLLTLRNPSTSSPIDIDSKDRSIQVHAAPCKLREVQILHDVLMSIIDCEKTLCPSDIVVMAPKIADYVPFIETVFVEQEKKLPIQFADLLLKSQNTLAKGLEQLFNLSGSRWKVSDFMQLLQNPAFLRKKQFDSKDADQINRWIEDAKIHWGQDGEHFESIFQEEYGITIQHVDEFQSTWAAGFSKILREFFGDQEDETIPTYRFSQGDLLGKLWSLLDSLRTDLKILNDGTKLELSQWIIYLECLIDCYFQIDDQTDDNSERDQLIAQFRIFQGSAQKLSRNNRPALFPFSSIRPHLQQLLFQESMSLNEHRLQSIRFCSLLPMRAIPAKVVCLIGMEEEAFPRKELLNSLDISRELSQKCYCPSKSDFDRYLFLESMLSSRNYFIISFVDKDSDGSEKAPSTVVSEFLTYIDQSFNGGDTPLSKNILTRHPSSPHAKENFKNNATHFHSCSHKRYVEAQVLHQTVKKPAYRLFPLLHITTVLQPLKEALGEESLVINLSELNHAVSKPLRVYLNKTIQLYIESSKEILRNDSESFTLSHLDQHKIQTAALKQPLSKVISKAFRIGMLPTGILGQVAKEKISDQHYLYQKNMEKLGISISDLMEIRLDERCRIPYKHRNNFWVLPCPEFQIGQKKIKITGTITNLTSQGLVVLKDKKPKEIIQQIPSIMILKVLSEKYDFIPERALLTLKDGEKIKDKQRAELPKRLLQYYLLCKSNPCPLQPDWFEHVINADASKLQKAIEKSLGESYGTSYDNYHQWAFNSQDPPNAISIIELWQQPVENVFSDYIVQQTKEEEA